MPITRWLLASLRAPCCSTWPTKPQAQAPLHIPSHEHGSVLQQCEILPLFNPHLLKLDHPGKITYSLLSCNPILTFLSLTFI